MKKQHDKIIYLDHAATTPLDMDVFQKMTPYLTEYFANPSSPYSIAKNQRVAVEAARQQVATSLGTSPDTIIFTSGGTESDNLALFGVARQHKKQGGHIITTAIEHEAVIEPIKRLEDEGFSVTYLLVNRFGEVEPSDVRDALQPDTILVSVMYANNEIGTIEPIAGIGATITKWRADNKTVFPYFHTDACQAASTLSLLVDELGVDLMTLNGSKVYGPKGVGILYKREGIKIQPQILGGGQEKKQRSGTENVASIVGMAEALAVAQRNRHEHSEDVKKIRDYFWDLLQERLQGISLNGADTSSQTRLPNNLHVRFEGVESDSLIAYLDKFGIMCAAGSACSTESLEPSYVLMACGITTDEAQSSIRFTFGKENTKEEINYAVEKIAEAVTSMRKL